MGMEYGLNAVYGIKIKQFEEDSIDEIVESLEELVKELDLTVILSQDDYAIRNVFVGIGIVEESSSTDFTLDELLKAHTKFTSKFQGDNKEAILKLLGYAEGEELDLKLYVASYYNE